MRPAELLEQVPCRAEVVVFASGVNAAPYVAYGNLSSPFLVTGYDKMRDFCH